MPASPSEPGTAGDLAAELSRCGGWDEPVYRDLLAVQSGAMTSEAFDARYLRQEAILALDLTGFTENAMHGGSLASFLRILDAQKLCVPILRANGAERVHAFADDLVAIFTTPAPALDAALAIHRQVGAVRRDHPDKPECCIGIGWGPVYAIGANRAMGDEMNRTCKLGEDTARGGETLLTENARDALAYRADLEFEFVRTDDPPFPYFRVRGGT